MGYHCLQAKYRELRVAATFSSLRTRAWRDMVVVWDGKTRTQSSHNFARGSEHLRDRGKPENSLFAPLWSSGLLAIYS